MATLSHFPTFFISLSPRNSSFHNPFLAQTHFHCQQFLQFHHLQFQHSPRQHFAIRCSSIRKSRAGKKAMSDEDLCNELREFMSSVGFEEGNVPSMKELSDHGRKDLAHIVRRRGYKLIGELLAKPRETYIGESMIERNDVDKEDATADSENGITGQDKKADNMDEHVSLSTEALVTSSYGGSMTLEPLKNAREQSFTNVESPTLADATLQEKVANFIKNGKLDNFEDESGAEVFELNFKMDNSVEMESKSPDEEHLEYVSSESNDVVSFNGAIVTSEKSAPPARGDLFSAETMTSADSEKDLNFETNERENQAEINHLKLMLHQKELELSRLKEMIEKEKLALSTFQIKAESEISKAQKLVSEKDQELHAVEESLLGLKEVQIQYLGDGDIVEVAGSFNGWHHRVKMDPSPYPSIEGPIGSKKSTIWSTVLWLYPGEYEIKFVVDDQWKTDPHRESIKRGSIHNNILRVDR